MKKFLFSLATLAIILTITACTKSDQEKLDATTGSPTSTAVETENNETEKSSVSEETTVDSPEKVTKVSKTEKNSVSVTTKKNVVNYTHKVTEPTTKKKQPEKNTVKETTTASSKITVTYRPEEEIYRLHNMINNYRTANGLSQIKLDPELCELAYKRAVEQETAKGHTRPDGTEFYTILEEYNYDYMGVGENLSFLFNVPVETSFNNWKNSPTHNDNMLYPNWTKTGLALYRNAEGKYNIVQLFAY